jgi:ribosomal protein L44E
LGNPNHYEACKHGRHIGAYCEACAELGVKHVEPDLKAEVARLRSENMRYRRGVESIARIANDLLDKEKLKGSHCL